jgi:predicted transcriptional regulator
VRDYNSESVGPDPEAARQAVLEEVADRLLAASVQAGSEGAYPFYTERALRRALQEEEEHRPLLEAEPLPPADSSLQCALRLLTRSHLPRRKRLAFRLVARGYPQRRVARMLGMSHLQVRRWIVETCQDLQEGLTGRGSGFLELEQEIREVFRADMGRHAYAPERHCKAGNEGCRRSGLCVCRWYLHYLSE